MKDGLGAVQSVLLLGGTSEIGLAIVRALVAERARRVVLAVRDPDRGAQEAAALREAGAELAEPVAFDALEPGSHGRAVSEAFERLGDVDLVVLAFGVLGDQLRDERDAGAARTVVEANFTGAVSVLVEVAERLRSQGHGTIVVLSSVAAERPRRANFLYGSTKAGLDAFAQGLGDSLQGTGVRVLVVRPGFVATRMTEGLEPAPLSTAPEKVAETVVAGLRSGAHTVWAPPVLRAVMAVLRHLPRPLFRRLPG